jgi:hypothetical protein
MLDVSVSYNRYKFLGHEFLTWLWFMVEKDPKRLSETADKLEGLQIGNRVKLENNRNRELETITIKGDEAGLEEGLLALQKGAVVTELNLACKINSHTWQFTIKGESFHIANLKTPATGPLEEKTDFEGKILEKTYLYGEAIQLIETLFENFLNTRLSSDWKQSVIPHIRDWIYA